MTALCAHIGGLSADAKLHLAALFWKPVSPIHERRILHTPLVADEMEGVEPCSFLAGGKLKGVLRCEQDSNLRGNIPLDFESNALTTRPSQLHNVTSEQSFTLYFHPSLLQGKIESYTVDSFFRTEQFLLCKVHRICKLTLGLKKYPMAIRLTGLPTRMAEWLRRWT